MHATSTLKDLICSKRTVCIIFAVCAVYAAPMFLLHTLKGLVG